MSDYKDCEVRVVVPTTFARLSKAHRQVECARDETTDQVLREQLTDLAHRIAVVMVDVDGT